MVRTDVETESRELSSNEYRIRNMDLYLSKEINENSDQVLEYIVEVESVKEDELVLKITQENTFANDVLKYRITGSKKDLEKITEKEIRDILKKQLKSFFDEDGDIKNQEITYAFSYPIPKEVLESKEGKTIIVTTKKKVEKTHENIVDTKVDQARDRLNNLKSKTFGELVDMYNNPKEGDESVVILSLMQDRLKENGYIIDFYGGEFTIKRVIESGQKIDINSFNELSREIREQLLISGLMKSTGAAIDNYRDFANQIIIDKELNPTKNPNWTLSDLTQKSGLKIIKLINDKKETSKNNIQVLQELDFLEDYIKGKKRFKNENINALKLQQEASITFSSFANSSEGSKAKAEYERLTGSKIDNRSFSEKLTSGDIFGEFLNSGGGAALLAFGIIGSIFKIEGSKYALFAWLGMFVGKDVLKVLDKNGALDGVKQNIDESIGSRENEITRELPEGIAPKFSGAYIKMQKENIKRMNDMDDSIEEDRFPIIFKKLSENTTLAEKVIIDLKEITVNDFKNLLGVSNIDINGKSLTAEELNVFIKMLKNNAESGDIDVYVGDLFIKGTMNSPSLTTFDGVKVAASGVVVAAGDALDTVATNIDNSTANFGLPLGITTEIKSMLSNITNEAQRQLLYRNLKERVYERLYELSSFKGSDLQIVKDIEKLITDSKTLEYLNEYITGATDYIKKQNDKAELTNKISEITNKISEIPSNISDYLQKDLATINAHFTTLKDSATKKIETIKQKEKQIKNLIQELNTFAKKNNSSSIHKLVEGQIAGMEISLGQMESKLTELSELGGTYNGNLDISTLKQALEDRKDEIINQKVDNYLNSTLSTQTELVNFIKMQTFTGASLILVKTILENKQPVTIKEFRDTIKSELIDDANNSTKQYNESELRVILDKIELESKK